MFKSSASISAIKTGLRHPLIPARRLVLPTASVETTAAEAHYRAFSAHAAHAKHHSRPTEYYDMLGISQHATQAQVKAAYYAKSKVLHPDVNKHGDAEKQFLELTQAYRVLGDVDLRRRYDKGLGVSDAFTRSSESAAGAMRNARRQGPLDYATQYNFDEFYKKHYQASRQHEQLKKHHQEQMRQAVADRRSHARVVNLMFIMFVCGMFLLELK